MTMTPLTGQELAMARKIAAVRFAAIAAAETPTDVKVTFRKSLSGCAWVASRKISVPRPVTRRALHIYLHEIAHIVLDHRNQKPRHVEEFEAETWAFAKMREHGVAVPRKSLTRAKAYVARKIRQAKRRGAKHIDPRAAAFAR
jgi:hypothetical protein